LKGDFLGQYPGQEVDWRKCF